MPLPCRSLQPGIALALLLAVAIAASLGVGAAGALSGCSAVRPETQRARALEAARRCDEARGRWYAGDTDGARAALEEALALAPDDAGAWRLLGVLELGRGEAARARRLLERAVALCPPCHGARADLGTALLAEQRFDRAAEVFAALTAEADYDTPALAHAGLAWALHNLGRLREAAQQYRLAIALDPALCEGYAHLGLTYEALGDWAQALDAYAHGVRRCGGRRAAGGAAPVVGYLEPVR